MEKINEKMMAIAKEVSRQFGEIIGMSPEHFVGDDPTDVCCFGDCYFFAVGEMLDVLNGLDRYVKRYGSKEAVGAEIRDWYDWWLYPDGRNTADGIPELVRARVTHTLRPNISLRAWLDGCPRADRQPWSGPDARWMQLENDKATLERLISEYRSNRTLSNVLDSINTLLDREAKAKAERDFADWQRTMKGEAGQRFQETLDAETPE